MHRDSTILFLPIATWQLSIQQSIFIYVRLVDGLEPINIKE